MDGALQLTRSRLRFADPATEQDYLSVRLEPHRELLLSTTIGSLITWVVAGVFVPLLVAEHANFGILVRVACFGVFTPICLWTYSQLRKPQIPRWFTPVTAAANTAAGLWCALIGLAAPEVLTNGVIVGLTAIAMFLGGSLYGLRLRNAALALLPYTVVIQVQLLLYPGPDTTAQSVLYSFIVWVFFSVTMSAAYGLELSSRSSYIKDRTIDAERKRADDLLANMLPDSIAHRLKKGETVIADECQQVTILFADLVGFTVLSSKLSAAELVVLLNAVFSSFDALAAEQGVEKIKTIGDAYMLVAGVPDTRADHADAVASMALEMQTALRQVNEERGFDLGLRIGLHSGSAVAGVIGRSKFAYDLWGDAVNVAARMESHGEPGRIQMTGHTKDSLSDAFDVEVRGEIDVKGKGLMETWWLVGRANAEPDEASGSRSEESS